MRKLIILLVAILLPSSAPLLRANDNSQSIKIPLSDEPGMKNVRSLYEDSIESYYWGEFSGIQTVVTKEQGDINMYVSNITTGESWSYSFDSIMEPQSFIQLSGNPGYYEVEYVTESGDIYYGVFIIE